MLKTLQRHTLAHQAEEHAADEQQAFEPPPPPSRKLPFGAASAPVSALRQGLVAARERAHDDLAAQIDMILTLAPEIQAQAHAGVSQQLAGFPDSPAKQALLKQLGAMLGAVPARGRGVALSALMNAMDDLPPDQQVDAIMGILGRDAAEDGQAGNDAATDVPDDWDLVLPELSPEEQMQFLCAVTDAALAAGTEQRPAMLVFACNRVGQIAPNGDKIALVRQLGQSLSALPAKSQGQAWSALVGATATLPVAERAEMVDELAGGIEYARHSDNPAEDLTALGKMIASMPVMRRMRPLNSVFAAAALFGREAKMAIHAMASSASEGLPAIEHLALTQQREAVKESLFLAPAKPLTDEGGIAENLPNPWHDSHAFADAVEASDRIASGDALPSDGLDGGKALAGKAIGRAVITFNEPGLPRFRDLMRLLAADHQSMLQSNADYRDAVGQALDTGPVRISMSPQYPWAAACDQDSLGQHLISLNPNKLGSGRARIAAALAGQLREAAGCRGGGRKCALSVMRYAQIEDEDVLEQSIQADRLDPWV